MIYWWLHIMLSSVHTLYNVVLTHHVSLNHLCILQTAAMGIAPYAC